MNDLFRCLAAKLAAILLLTGFGVTSAHAGIPVIDASNLAQTYISAVQNVAAVTKQIQQYQTQLQQYANMLQNTTAPTSYVWDQAVTTMTNLRSALNALDTYTKAAGSLSAYLNNFQSQSSYQTGPCFNGASCTPAQLAALQASRAVGSQAQVSANNAAMNTIQLQQASLVKDANNLATLQAQAQGATGQMQAIGAANQLASASNNQLMQIRALLLAQATAVTARQQAQENVEAQQAAADAQARAGTFVASPVKTY